jgi:transposase
MSRHVTKITHVERRKRKLAAKEDLANGLSVTDAMAKYDLGKRSIQAFAREAKKEKIRKMFPREYPCGEFELPESARAKAE